MLLNIFLFYTVNFQESKSSQVRIPARWRNTGIIDENKFTHKFSHMLREHILRSIKSNGDPNMLELLGRKYLI